MRLLLIPLALISIAACGPSQEEKERIAAVTCAVMGESKKALDAAFRVEKINEAREKIGGEPFLSGDVAIKEAFEYGLCQQLVLGKDYELKIREAKDAEARRKRFAEEEAARKAEEVAKAARIKEIKEGVKEFGGDMRRLILSSNEAQKEKSCPELLDQMESSIKYFEENSDSYLPVPSLEDCNWYEETQFELTNWILDQCEQSVPEIKNKMEKLENLRTLKLDETCSLYK